jgi:hypothetical protein
MTGGHVCAECGTSLVGKGKGAIVHHIKEYSKAPALGTERQNLKPLCSPCHNRTHGAMRRGASGACDMNGNPLDARHPWFASTARKINENKGGRVPSNFAMTGRPAGKFSHVYLGFYPANPSQPAAHPRQPYSVCGRPLSYRAIRRWCLQ